MDNIKTVQQQIAIEEKTYLQYKAKHDKMRDIDYLSQLTETRNQQEAETARLEKEKAGLENEVRKLERKLDRRI